MGEIKLIWDWPSGWLGILEFTPLKVTKGVTFEIQNRNLFKISFPTFLKHHSKRYRAQIPRARRKTSYLKYIHQRLRFIMSVNFDQCMFISSLFSSTHICIECF